MLAITSAADRDAVLRFVDPAAGAKGADFKLFLDGAEAQPTLRLGSGPHGNITMFTVVADTAARRGHLTVSGHVRAHSAVVDTVLSTQQLVVHNSTRLGDSISDQVTILGHLTQRTITIDLGPSTPPPSCDSSQFPSPSPELAPPF